jgi:hypothetical protein
VNAAADAALLAIDQPNPGIYNIAQSNRHVATEMSRGAGLDSRFSSSGPTISDGGQRSMHGGPHVAQRRRVISEPGNEVVVAVSRYPDAGPLAEVAIARAVPGMVPERGDPATPCRSRLK